MEKLMYPFMTRLLLPEEGGGYLIEFPDLPGCTSDGETLEDAIENGKDALQCWIEAAAEDGQEIPEPGSSPTWVQQVPTDVHRQLSKRATAEGVKAPKHRGLGLCFIAVRLPRKVLRLLHRGTQAAPQDIDGSVDVPIVV